MTGVLHEITASLRAHGLAEAADRIGYLQDAVADDPDEEPIAPESLHSLARFLIAERGLPLPRIAVGPDGLMQIEWRGGNGEIVAMKFLLDGRIQFAAVGADREGAEPDRISGALSREDAMRALLPLMSPVMAA